MGQSPLHIRKPKRLELNMTRSEAGKKALYTDEMAHGKKFVDNKGFVCVERVPDTELAVVYFGPDDFMKVSVFYRK